MYEVFDSYLGVDTWHTNHPNDEERFFRALAKVVRNPNFNPDEMGSYMREQKGVDRDDDDARGLSQNIDRRVLQAWAIKEFLDFGL